MTRVVFFGTPIFGRIVLEELLARKFKIVAVVTQPDSPVGRSQKLAPSPVKTLAKEKKISVLAPEGKKELTALVAKLKALKPDLFAVGAYGRMIPNEILEVSPHGTLNVHPSLLPKYRGPSPIQTAILRGEPQTGVSIILLDEQMDHGPLLASRATPITPTDTTPLLKEKLGHLGGELLAETIPAYLAGQITPQPQDDSIATYTKLLTREDGKIDWGGKNDEILRALRAYHPWPGIWTTLGELAEELKKELRNPAHANLRVKILSAHTEEEVLSLDLVQVEGKNPLTFLEFAKGYLK